MQKLNFTIVLGISTIFWKCCTKLISKFQKLVPTHALPLADGFYNTIITKTLWTFSTNMISNWTIQETSVNPSSHAPSPSSLYNCNNSLGWDSLNRIIWQILHNAWCNTNWGSVGSYFSNSYTLWKKCNIFYTHGVKVLAGDLYIF